MTQQNLETKLHSEVNDLKELELEKKRQAGEPIEQEVGKLSVETQTRKKPMGFFRQSLTPKQWHQKITTSPIFLDHEKFQLSVESFGKALKFEYAKDMFRSTQATAAVYKLYANGYFVVSHVEENALLKNCFDVYQTEGKEYKKVCELI